MFSSIALLGLQFLNIEHQSSFLTMKRVFDADEESVIRLKALENASKWSLSWDCLSNYCFQVLLSLHVYTSNFMTTVETLSADKDWSIQLKALEKANKFSPQQLVSVHEITWTQINTSDLWINTSTDLRAGVSWVSALW